MTRRWELDALRGLMLVLMVLTHLPTRLASPLGQPLGFVSAAEGFVMLSAYMAGMVYTLRARRDGELVMQEAFLRRALKIYACQAGLMVFLFTVVASIDLLTDEEAIRNLTSFYRQDPGAALFGAALLLYNPPLLDILPMYIVFMLASPVLLLHGLHQGFDRLLAGSLLLWVGAQFGVGAWLYDQAVALTGLPVPAAETGAFSLLAWQFLWVLGLWMGSTRVTRTQPPPPFPRWMVVVAAVIALVGIVGRHTLGQVPFGENAGLNTLQDKWHLGPLRLLDFLALMLLAMHFAPWLKRHLPRLRFLEVFGAASLTVFCVHLMLALVALALVGESRPERAAWVDPLILVGSFAVLYAVAWGQQWLGRRTAVLVTSRKTPSRRATPSSPAR